MINQFKHLEEIAKDKNVSFGDLIILRKSEVYDDGIISYDIPVFYGKIDNYISDGRAGFKKNKKFKGIRTFHHRREDGRLEANDDYTIFYHHKKGLLIPFDDGDKYKYSLLMKSNCLPK